MTWFLLLFACLAAAFFVRGVVRSAFAVDPSSDYYLASVFGAAAFIGAMI